MKPEDVSIVIPAYNEENAIRRVITSIQDKNSESEIIVVDDGSDDSTYSEISDLDIIIIRHARNRGCGSALRTGILRASKSYVLFCDADGQHSADDVMRIISECDGHDMVVGVRGPDSHVPLSRKVGKMVLNKFANFLAGEKIPDLNSGLRIMEKQTILKYLHLMPHGFSFSTTTTFAMIKTHHTIKWVPITVDKRVGKSSVNQFVDGPQAIILMLRLIVLFEPLKIFLSASGVLFILNILSFVVDMMSQNGNGIGDTTVLLSVATLIVFMFGLLCDQVSSLRREIHE